MNLILLNEIEPFAKLQVGFIALFDTQSNIFNEFLTNSFENVNHFIDLDEVQTNEMQLSILHNKMIEAFENEIRNNLADYTFYKDVFIMIKTECNVNSDLVMKIHFSQNKTNSKIELFDENKIQLIDLIYKSYEKVENILFDLIDENAVNCYDLINK